MTCIVLQEPGNQPDSAPNKHNPMNKTILTRYHLERTPLVILEHGYIDASDSSSPENISIYAGSEAIYDAIAQLLPSCPRSTQERFMQILTDHIRKMENAEA